MEHGRVRHRTIVGQWNADRGSGGDCRIGNLNLLLLLLSLGLLLLLLMLQSQQRRRLVVVHPLPHQPRRVCNTWFVVRHPMSYLYRLPALLRKYLSKLVNVAECVWSCAQNEPFCGKERFTINNVQFRWNPDSTSNVKSDNLPVWNQTPYKMSKNYTYLHVEPLLSPSL